MKKKLLILSAVIGLVLACFPFTLYAEEDPESDLGVDPPYSSYALDSYFYNNYYLLPYVQADGNQYVNLGINYKNSYKVSVRFSDLVPMQEMNPIIYAAGANRYGLIYRYNTEVTNQYRFYFYTNSQYYAYELEPFNIYEFVSDGNEFKLNGYTYTFTDTDFTSSKQLQLFNDDSNTKLSNVKIYSVFIYDNDTDEYIMYLYPAKSKSGEVIGFYDSISKTFLTTATASPFENPTDDKVIGFQISDFITAGLGWIGDILDFAIAEPMIIMFMAIGLAGAMFRWGRRLIHF